MNPVSVVLVKNTSVVVVLYNKIYKKAVNINTPKIKSIFFFGLKN